MLQLVLDMLFRLRLFDEAVTLMVERGQLAAAIQLVRKYKIAKIRSDPALSGVPTVLHRAAGRRTESVLEYPEYRLSAACGRALQAGALPRRGDA